jgi:peptidoglycan/LPS O-acetylase OafA/YrhL
MLCGSICYSLYLVVVRAVSTAFHRLGLRGDPVTLFVTTPVCVAASLAAALVFHRAVERRFLNPQETPAPRPRG